MSRDPLWELARLYGVQTAYLDAQGKLCRVQAEPLCRVLRALGAAVDSLQDVPQAVRQRRQSLWRTVMEPVTVAWEGTDVAVELRLGASEESGPFQCVLHVENGEPVIWTGRLEDLPVRRQRTVEGVRYTVKRLAVPGSIPFGYHRLRVELQGQAAETLVLAAPAQAYVDDSPERQRLWGVFLPLYALWRRTSWGAGDLGDLEALIRWTASLGGSFVETLPLLAELWERGDGPAPYSPASRLFWNEFYLDMTQVIPRAPSPSPAELAEKAPLQRELDALRHARLVDYAAIVRIKRDVLMGMSDWYFSRGDRAGLEQYCREHPLAERFAAFRATGERLGKSWRDWAQPLRGGEIRPGDYDPRIYQFHLYTQWQMQRQLQSLAEEAAAQRVLLCLDLPLGVGRDGFDTWLEQDLFVPEMSLGAPPDVFFSAGQNWGLPAAHPQRQRRQGYRYFIACLRHHMQLASVLRVDHVMGLYRQFWVPEGMEARLGVYVRYPVQEMLAIMAIESRRHHVMLVGENLGTVPDAVNKAMARRRVHSMYVLPFEVSPGESSPLRPAPADSLASLNTHDMPPFAAFLDALDIQDRLELGLLDAAEAARQRRDRQAICRRLSALLKDRGLLGGKAGHGELLVASLAMLAQGQARMVRVNLEDLWGEKMQQNVPGTSTQRPNWRRRALHSLEEFSELPNVLRVLRTIDRARRRPGQ